MLDNFAFTLYELFGYLLPGGISLLGFVFIFWALFLPKVPLGVATFQPGFATWTAIIVVSYVLGHAAQALGNKLLRKIETHALEMTGAKWMKDRARQTAAELLGVPPLDVGPRWVYRVLDEYTLQAGKPGDRDMFIYREGFYRGTAIALFFLSLAVGIRLVIPGTAIHFTKWDFQLTYWPLLLSAAITAGLGWLFLQRYIRFTDYRITRAALTALVIRKVSSENDSGENKSAPAE